MMSERNSAMLRNARFRYLTELDNVRLAICQHFRKPILAIMTNAKIGLKTFKSPWILLSISLATLFESFTNFITFRRFGKSNNLDSVSLRNCGQCGRRIVRRQRLDWSRHLTWPMPANRCARLTKPKRNGFRCQDSLEKSTFPPSRGRPPNRISSLWLCPQLCKAQLGLLEV